MKVGFLFPFWSGANGLFGYFTRRVATWPPLNLALLAAIAEQNGHQVFVIDGQAEGLSVEEMARRTLAENPDIVGFTASSPFFHVQVAVAERLKELRPDLPIMAGGPHVTIMKEKAFRDCFDYLFVGESEFALPEFLDALERGGDIAEVKGLITRTVDGGFHFAGPAKRVEDFDSLPFPARHLLDMDRYKLGTSQGRVNFTSIQTTRGCPWKCIFCASKDLDTTRILRRSPASVVAEIKHAVETYGISHFYIADDVLTLYEEHILEICDGIEAAGLKITFEGATRANLVNEPLIKRLAECGLVRLAFGLESANAKIRDTMKKKVPLKYYMEANRILNKYDIEALNTVMIGLPGESRESVRETLDFMAQSKDVKLMSLSIAIPYPGTEFFNMAMSGDHGIEVHTTDFSEYQRYGAAVTTVNGLSPAELVELQNEGFVRFYSAPWRWRPMLAKHGIFGGLLTLLRVGRMITDRMFRRRRNGATAAGHYGAPQSPNG